MKVSLSILTLLFFTCFINLNAQSYAFDGQVIGWSTLHPVDPFQVQTGLRFIPEFNFTIPVKNLVLEGEASLNTWGSLNSWPGDSTNSDAKLDPYRAWIRLSGDRFEVRAGLQKINFGSANMIRPLMWFDQLDPKDPLRLTKGVYGVLGRYYFLNNANLWAWGLYGNNERKGLEVIPSRKNSFEVGGRAQFPIPIGEFAFTYHHRETDSLNLGNFYPENRFAFDTKIDAIVGLWFEGALIRKHEDFPFFNNNTLLNAGADYTFALGNGLNILAEGLYYMQGSEAFKADIDIAFAGISMSYPISIIHNISAILFIDISNNELYRFINWSMTFDRWTFFTMAYWNPNTYQLPGFNQDAGIFSGAGIQLMAVYNY